MRSQDKHFCLMGDKTMHCHFITDDNLDVNENYVVHTYLHEHEHYLTKDQNNFNYYCLVRLGIGNRKGRQAI